MNVTDWLKSILDSYIGRLVGRVDYCAHYPCTVVSQNADGTLELRPDSPLWPGLSNILIRYGIPGITVTVASGARVTLYFENADPSAPRAAIWEASSLTSITINASAGVTVNAATASITTSGNCSINASGTCTVSGAQVQLAGGGAPIARVGDPVFIPSTGGAGSPSTGIIQQGSSRVTSG